MSRRVVNESSTQDRASTARPIGITRRQYLRTSALVGATAGFAGCLGGADDSLTVGYVLPFTGVYSLLGDSIVDGFEMYVDEQGGEIAGQEVEFVSRDTEADTDTGVSVARELLVEAGADALVGPVSSAVAIAMMQTVENESSAIWLNANAGDYRVVQDGCLPYHFRTSFNDWQTSAPLAPWVYENVADNVVITYADYAFGQNSRDFFAEAFEEAGGEVLGEVTVPLGTDDFSPYMGDIEGSGADAVYSFFAGSDAVNYVTQFHEFGLDEEMVQTGSGFLLDEDSLPAQGSAAVGKYSLLHYASNHERTQEFVESYREEHDEIPNVYACQGYDSAQAFELAIEEGGTDLDAMVEALRGAEIDSPRGDFSFHPETNDPVQDMYVREVVEGDDGPENEVVETIEAVESPAWGCSLD
ncbi:MAG: ABC transporter substrate-binding protein [Halalkalicoccus sp.]